MDAQVGDRLTIHPNKVGAPPRSGTVVECLGSGARHYRVRWDDGRETVLSPGSDAVVEHHAETKAGSAGDPVEVVTSIELRFAEDDRHTEATATLATRWGTLTGRGTARRNPVDPNIPLVGEELAAARALVDLADALRQAAGDVQQGDEHPETHLTSA
jgi:hypothetical protein